MIDARPGDIFHQGQVLNNTYEIEGVLGRGGTGEVYRARNQISGRIVAIKALNAQFSGNDDYIELMKREEQMRDIQNDAVVRYTECSRSDRGHVFLVMDYVDGPSMADVMARRRIEPRELMIIAHRVAEGLVAAHRGNIVHRDLSPDNVILRGDNPERATIIDFGIAKDTAAGARTIVGNDFAGKYEYAAPEQLEGRAEPRSDLYALGALLLAAFHGQVPFAGATPGEMIRRKQVPLDLGGVPEPLKGLIGWLAAPALTERAPSAAAVVAMLNQTLKPDSTRGTGRGPASLARGRASTARWGWLALPVLLGLGGVVVYYGGLLDRVLVQPLPVASPYTLTARAVTDGAAAALSGNVPDSEAQAAIAAAFASVSGALPDPAALTLSQGAPPDWSRHVVAGLAALGDLEDWTLTLSGGVAEISGLAPDVASRLAAETRLKDWSATAGMDMTLTLATGPRLLPYEVVADALREVADCGPLNLGGPAAQPYLLGATIDVTGSVSGADRAGAIEEHLRSLVGDRTLRVDLVPLNPDLCAVRQVLPVLPDSALSIRLSQGATGEPNLSGIFHEGDNPVVEVLAPSGMNDGKLWVVVVDNTGKVFNIVPSIYSEETDIADLGVVENGVRWMRVLFAQSDAQKGKPLLAITVNDGDFGKSEIIAILSRQDLFETRRPRDESIASFAEALAETQKLNPGNIVGMANRILDARP